MEVLADQGPGEKRVSGCEGDHWEGGKSCMEGRLSVFRGKIPPWYATEPKVKAVDSALERGLGPRSIVNGS